MSIAALKHIDHALVELRDSAFSNLGQFEFLGVHPGDKEAQIEFSTILTHIANGLWSPKYNPETQLIEYQDIDGKTRAVWKPGAMRASDETFTRRMLFTMGLPFSVAPAMAMTFDYSALREKTFKAFDLNPEAFDLEIASSGSEEDEEDELQFSPTKTGSKIKIEEEASQLSDFPFAKEDYRSGLSTYYLPNGPLDVFKHTDLTLKGKLVGVLEPWIESKAKEEPLNFYKTLIVAAVLGMRDLKEDAFIGSTIIDSEEIMAAAVAQRATLHFPVLGEKLDYSTKNLTLEEIEEIREIVKGWDVDGLVAYIKAQKQNYRLLEIESKNKIDDESIRVLKFKDENITCFNEKSGREIEFFPHIDLHDEKLYTDSQVGSFRNRLENLKRVFDELGDDQATWPEMNIWGLINQIDPEYGMENIDLCELRHHLVNPDSPPRHTDLAKAAAYHVCLSPKDVLDLRLDSSDANVSRVVANVLGRRRFVKVSEEEDMRSRSGSESGYGISSLGSSPSLLRVKSEGDEEKSPTRHLSFSFSSTGSTESL